MKPPRANRRTIGPAQRRLLLLLAAGLLLSMAGGLVVAVVAYDRVTRTIGVVVLNLTLVLLATLGSLWRQWRAESPQRRR